MKSFLKSFLYLNILVLSLILVNLVPNFVIRENLCESVEYYKNINFTQKFNVLSKNDPSADCNELNIMMNVDSSRPVYSSFFVPFYREFDNQDFITMAYKTIISEEEPNYNYNRYWHGYQILWRPLMLLFNASQIMNIMLIGYIILFLFLLYKLVILNYKNFALGIFLMNIIYIIPFGFNALEYIPLFYICVISCLLLLSNKVDNIVLFCCSGISIAFFDFLTAETLTLTIPLLLYVHINKKNIKFRYCTKLGLSWMLGYCFTFLYKWFLSTVFLKENFFKIALEKYETHQSPFDKIFSLKTNINILFGNVSSVNTTFTIFLVLVTVLLITLYLFRRDKSEKYIITILLICIIPYIRYYVISDHSFGYAWFTYRAQLVLIPALILLLAEIDFKLVKKRSK